MASSLFGDVSGPSRSAPELHGTQDVEMGNGTHLSLFNGGYGTQWSFDGVDAETTNELDENDLVQALQEFNNAPAATVEEASLEREPSSPHRQSLSPSTWRDPPPPQAMYELRPINRQRPMTWLDQDKSGNYDPEEEAKKLKDEEKKRRKRMGKSTAKPRRSKAKMLVTLRLNSTEGYELLHEGQDNWPDGHFVISEDEGRPSRRSKKIGPPQVPIPDPRGEVEDLTGLPLARGCKTCRKQLKTCSMVEDGSWPCTQCIEVDVGSECEYLREPRVKSICRRCKDENLPCSFMIRGINHQGHCKQCDEVGVEKCVAGPAPGHEYVRTSMDTGCGPDRLYASCTNCRILKQRCSLKSKHDKPPCAHCKGQEIGCTFGEVPIKKGPKRKARSGLDEDQDVDESAEDRMTLDDLMTMLGMDPEEEEDTSDNEDQTPHEATANVEMIDRYGNRGICTEIDTSFAHPIMFTTPLDSDEQTYCNFCEAPAFGLYGHGERRPFVIAWNNGLGYTELAAGHREDHPQTTLCGQCTMTRFQVIHCEHDVKPDPYAEEIRRYQDANDALDALVQAEPHSLIARYETGRWCSFCMLLATYRCCTPQASLMDTDEGGEREMQGCGLSFCDACHADFLEEFDGNLDAMVHRCEKLPKGKELKDLGGRIIRADVGFLLQDGLLNRNMKTAFEKMELAEQAEDMDEMEE